MISEKFAGLFADNLQGISCDHQFLVGGNDPNLDLGIGGRDLVLLTGELCVELRIDLDAHKLHVGADAQTDILIVLADTAGEQHCVHTAHGGSEGGNVFFDLIFLDVQSQLCSVVAGGSGGGDIPVIAGNAGNAQHTGLLVHHVVELGDGHALFFSNVGGDRGIDAAAAGTHDYTVQRGQAHGGIHRFAVVHSGDGGAVAQMAGDNLQLLNGFAHQLCQTGADISVGGSMETVFANAVFLIILVGNGIDVSFLRHGLMESGVKHGNLRDILGEYLLAGTDAGDAGGIVQRRQVGKLLRSGDHILGYQSGGGEFGAALYHTMADGADGAGVLDDGVVSGAIYQKSEDCIRS